PEDDGHGGLGLDPVEHLTFDVVEGLLKGDRAVDEVGEAQRRPVDHHRVVVEVAEGGSGRMSWHVFGCEGREDRLTTTVSPGTGYPGAETRGRHVRLVMTVCASQEHPSTAA